MSNIRCHTGGLSMILAMLLLLCSCNDNISNVSEQPLFVLVEDSGIDFVNELRPTVEFSAFDYVYYQNGGGVAVADFDMDGLEDVFFTSNLHSDKLYRNLGNLQFEDITESSGVSGIEKDGTNHWSTGVTITDVDQNGLPDIYVCRSGRSRRGIGTENLLYVNQGGLKFKELGAEYGLNDRNSSTQATFFDYDKDGDLDAFILNHSPQFGNPDVAYQLGRFPQSAKPHSCTFYENRNGKYVDITERAGIIGFSYGLGVVASDLNNDGWTDLYVAQDFSIPDKMYINDGNGAFVDVLKESVGHISQYSMGCDVADIDNDGLKDISVVDMAPATHYRSKTLMPSMSRVDFLKYVQEFSYTPQYMYNTMQLAQGNGKYSEVAKLAGIHKSDWSWSTLLADFDNDGMKDQLVTNGYKYNRMQNDFAIAMDSMMNVYDRNPPPSVRAEWIERPPSYKLRNKLFKNKGKSSFEDVSRKWGFDIESFSNGAAYSDLDNDGDLDLIINNLDDRAFVYENRTNANFLQISFQSNGRPDLSRSLNSTVVIYTSQGIQSQELTLTRGYESSSSAVLNFGLANEVTVDSMVVFVPRLGVQVLHDIKVNQRLTFDLNSEHRFTPGLPARSTEPPLFQETQREDLSFYHQENDYDDFQNELLLPHMMSRFGPFISKADVNSDDLDDVYIGGAAGKSGVLFVQQSNGSFDSSDSITWHLDRGYEDMQSCFLDVDYDGDMDLYVVSGGNEWKPNSEQYIDRLYLNDGHGHFTRSKEGIPALSNSGSCAIPLDYNNDGRMDLFVGGRMKPQHYPYSSSSALLKNEQGRLIDVSDSFASILSSLGIVTDAVMADILGDEELELIVVGEWMYPRVFNISDNRATEVTPEEFKLRTGWWNCVESADIDGDGDSDLILGNLGLNYKYKASEAAPFSVYANDFDKSGDLDIILSYESEGKELPVRGRECSSEQIPELLERFPSYHDFASASLIDIYGENLEKSLHLSVTDFASSLCINQGDGTFQFDPLPIEAQFSSVNDIVVLDADHDGRSDILVAGNLFSSEVETPRNDASFGCLLLGDGHGNFTALRPYESGLYLNKDVKDIEIIRNRDGFLLLIANNNAELSIVLFD